MTYQPQQGDNVVYLDFGGPSEARIWTAPPAPPPPAPPPPASQPTEPAVHQIAVPAAMAMQMALQMFMAASGYAGTPAERATVAMMALARVTANLLHELGAHGPEHQAAAMENMAESVRLNLQLLQAGAPS